MDVASPAGRLMKLRVLYQVDFGACLQWNMSARRFGVLKDAVMQVEMGIYKPQ